LDKSLNRLQRFGTFLNIPTTITTTTTTPTTTPTTPEGKCLKFLFLFFFAGKTIKELREENDRLRDQLG